MTDARTRRTRARTLATTTILTLVAAMAFAAPAAADMHAETVEVGGDSNVFTPDSVEVEEGDTVLFEWVGGNHDVTFEDDVIGASETTSEDGFTFTATFDEAGTFAYTCTVHGGMDGEIVVVAADAGGADETDASDDTDADDADEVAQPSQVDAGTGGLSTSGLPLVLALMALGAVALGAPIAIGRRH